MADKPAKKFRIGYVTATVWKNDGADKFELRRIHDLIGTTTIFVTHDQDEALALSDRIAVLDGGKLQQFGTADEIYRHPKTRFIAEFMVTNIIETTLKSDGGTLVAEDETGRRIALPDVKGLKAGDKLAIGIRAEQLSLASIATGSKDWVATVERKFFLGNSFRYFLRCDPHQFVAQIAAPHANEIIGVGDQVALHWNADMVQVLPALG